MSNNHAARKAAESSTPGSSGPIQENISSLPVVAIVGSPSAGKSVIFTNLRGRHATVSHYPGTTPEGSRGRGGIEGKTFGVVDTPGRQLVITGSQKGSVQTARECLLRPTHTSA